MCRRSVAQGRGGHSEAVWRSLNNAIMYFNHLVKPQDRKDLVRLHLLRFIARGAAVWHLLSTWLQRCVPVPIWGHRPQHRQSRSHDRPGEELPERPRVQIRLPRGRISGDGSLCLQHA